MNMNKVYKGFIYLTAIVLMGMNFIYAGEGLDYMKSVLNRFEVLRGELVNDFTIENRRTVTNKAKQLSMEVLDVDEIGRLALGKNYKKMTAKQKKDFTGIFHKLMASRVAEANIPSQKIVSKEIPIQIIKDKSMYDRIFRKDALVVMTKVPHKRITYHVDFKLFRKNGILFLYDIVIDGASTLLDFRNQFSAIIKKKGVNYLINRLQSKISELEKQEEDRLSKSLPN